MEGSGAVVLHASREQSRAQVNTSVTLTAKCNGTPMSYAWTGCPSNTSTCRTASANAGPRTYSVTATNSTGTSTPAATTINWQAASPTPAPTPAPTPGTVSCTLAPSNANPVVNTPLTLTAACTGNPTSYTWTSCASATASCTTTSGSPGAAVYSVVARSATSTSATASASVNWQTPPVAPAGLPTSADFVPKASDPRGIDAGYNTFKRANSGRAIPFGGASHNRAGNNAVVSYDPSSDRWTVHKAHMTWQDRPVAPALSGPPFDARGLGFLGNSDNGVALVVDDEYWHLHGQRGVSIVGNHRGILDTRTWQWTHIDDTGSGDWPPLTLVNDTEFRNFENAAAGYVPSLDKWYVFGGTINGNPFDGLYRIERDPGGARPLKATFFGSPVSRQQAFPGSERLRYISNQHFVRGAKVYVYGGLHENRTSGARTNSSVLWEIDIEAPSMRVYATNSLPSGQRLEGEKLLAYYDPTKDMAVVTNGVRVNVFDFAAGAWVDIPVNTPSDSDRESPSSQSAGRAAFYSPEVGQLIILGGHSKVYGLRLNYGATPTPSPSPTPSPVPSPSPTPAPVPVPGALKLSVASVPYIGDGSALARQSTSISRGFPADGTRSWGDIDR